MVRLRRAQMVNLVEHSYYSNIDFRRLGTVLDCFAHDAVLAVGGRQHHGRDEEIKRFLIRLLESCPLIRHGDFSHDVDEPGQRLACRFSLRLEDALGGIRETAGRSDFLLDNGKLKAVSVTGGDDGPMI